MPSSAAFRPALARLAGASPVWAAAVVIASVALIAWSARVIIPMPPVPITLQSYAVITLAALLGWQLGGLAALAYVGMGLAGFGVFSGGRAGMGMITGPSGGFIVGFVVAAIVVGALEERWARLRILPLFGVLLLGHAVLLALGAGWMAHLTTPNYALQIGLLPFIPGAVVKTIAALATVILVERLGGARPAH